MPDLSISSLQAQVQKLTLALRKYVPIDGITTLTGRLLVSNDPRGDLEVATKHYVDVKTAGILGTILPSIPPSLSVSDNAGHALTGVQAVQFVGAVLSGTSQNAVITVASSAPVAVTTIAPVLGETPSGVVDGVNATFNLSQPATGVSLYTRQLRYGSSAFTLSGQTITITDPRAIPSPGNFFLVDYLPVSVSTPSTFVLEETPGGIISGANAVFTLAHPPKMIALYVEQIRYGISAVTLTNSGFTITDPRAIPKPGDFFIVSYTY